MHNQIYLVLKLPLFYVALFCNSEEFEKFGINFAIFIIPSDEHLSPGTVGFRLIPARKPEYLHSKSDFCYSFGVHPEMHMNIITPHLSLPINCPNQFCGIRDSP